jgi:hypothetical protein
MSLFACIAANSVESGITKIPFRGDTANRDAEIALIQRDLWRQGVCHLRALGHTIEYSGDGGIVLKGRNGDRIGLVFAVRLNMADRPADLVGPMHWYPWYRPSPKDHFEVHAVRIVLQRIELGECGKPELPAFDTKLENFSLIDDTEIAAACRKMGWERMGLRIRDTTHSRHYNLLAGINGYPVLMRYSRMGGRIVMSSILYPDQYDKTLVFGLLATEKHSPMTLELVDIIMKMAMGS